MSDVMARPRSNPLLPLRLSLGMGEPQDGDSDSIGEPKLVPERGEQKPLLEDWHAELFARWIMAKNIADELDDATISKLASQAKREYELDDNSRADWKSKYVDWLKFAMQVIEAKTYPWPGSSNVIFPLITTAALQFNARAYPAIVVGRNVVKGAVVGDDKGVAEVDPQTNQPAVDPQTNQPHWIIQPGALQQRADRIGRHMSWQLLEEMPEWEEQTDRLLMMIPIVGCMFRKTYRDVAGGRNMSETVDAMRVCVNYKAKSFETAPRISEEIDVYPWDIETNVRAGLWLDHGAGGYGHNIDAGDDEQAPVTFIEQHRRFDLDGDGYDEPIIVTFARDSGKLARISVGFDEEGVEANDIGEVQKIEPIRYYTKFGFVPSPDGGVYDVGFGHFLYPLNAAINTSINQLFDAGHLQIAGGGFLGSGSGINSGAIRFMMGEFKPVAVPGKTLRENLVQLDMPGPNAVLLSLLQYLVEAAREVASIKDILTGDIPGANVPGILGLAVIQQGLKVFNAIFKRVHRSLKAEYGKLFRLNRLYMPGRAGYQIGSEYFAITRQDYEEGAAVQPVSDPDMVTDVQQMAQANFLLTFKDDPMVDQLELRRRAMTAASITEIDKLLAAKPPPNAELTQALAQLELDKKLVDLRELELKIRAAHQEADQDIRRGKMKAEEIQLLTQSIKNLADARKADHSVDQSWYDLQLAHYKHHIDLLNAAATIESPESSPAFLAGNASTTRQLLAGLAGGGVPGMASPPGNQGGPPVPQ
jgi:chaperonin GroES